MGGHRQCALAKCIFHLGFSLDFGEQPSEAKQIQIVNSVKYPPVQRKGGGITIRDFVAVSLAPTSAQILKKPFADCLRNWVRMSNHKRRSLLAEAFLDQWEQKGYAFFKAPRSDVDVSGLTIKVVPDIEVRVAPDVPVMVRLWLNKGPMSEVRKRCGKG